MNPNERDKMMSAEASLSKVKDTLEHLILQSVLEQIDPLSKEAINWIKVCLDEIRSHKEKYYGDQSMPNGQDEN